ncbi:hypothetical protein ABIF99_000890 [Bradyrhizobium japonicum]|nr:hypothetical protein [Bradyrhizobium japonicum]BCF48073.1 hypothetical protein XF16B_85630 [Bradyrhizobium diazoefficiens]MCP1865585.1 hypothetical protein [Bradyrhizobium japonicum]MCP1895644.1 hypothetical protein [Bradyrhizobium japonicum]MCW2329027.1 hypothetical protein [Bradyrhizobium japonicum]
MAAEIGGRPVCNMLAALKLGLSLPDNKERGESPPREVSLGATNMPSKVRWTAAPSWRRPIACSRPPRTATAIDSSRRS